SQAPPLPAIYTLSLHDALPLSIVEDPVTISLMTRRANTSAEDWNQVSSVQETQEITNIEIDWGLVGEEAVAERRNLTLTSGEYPDRKSTRLNSSHVSISYAVFC